MRTSRAEVTGARASLERLAEPLTELKDRLTEAAGDAQDRIVGARDSAVDAIAGKPFRWTTVAFLAGLIVGAVLGSRRNDW